MDTRNVIAAISLSAAVIILYSLFFQPDPAIIKQNLAEQKKIENNTDTPSLDKNENFAKLSRTDALKKNDRIQFENNSVVGSISLRGATIDDLTFKNYNIELNGNVCFSLFSECGVSLHAWPRRMQCVVLAILLQLFEAWCAQGRVICILVIHEKLIGPLSNMIYICACVNAACAAGWLHIGSSMQRLFGTSSNMMRMCA